MPVLRPDGRLWPRSVGVGPAYCRAFYDGLGVFPPDSGRVTRWCAWNSSQRGGPISTETRVNERIRVPEVRLIGPGGAGGHCAYQTHFASPRTRVSTLSKLLPMPDRRSARTTASTSTRPRRRRESHKPTAKPSSKNKAATKMTITITETKGRSSASWRRDPRSQGHHYVPWT